MARLKWSLLSGSQDMSSGRGRAGWELSHNTNDSASFLIFVNMNLVNSTPSPHQQDTRLTFKRMKKLERYQTIHPDLINSLLVLSG